MNKTISKIISIFLCLCFLSQQVGFTQVAAELDLSAHFARLHNSISVDKFRPLHLRYLSYDTLNNNFKLLLDKGDSIKGLSQSKLSDTISKGSVPEEELKSSTKELLNYFFIGISLPNDSFWVNLRPDSPDNIIDPYLAQTDVGKILLEADLQLKKDTALSTSPQTIEGKEYWGKLYKKAEELFGAESITIPTLTRPWIVPGEIIIRESTDNAYIYKATLKVMLEQDYLAQGKGIGAGIDYSFKDERLKKLNEYSTELIKETIIPKLTKDINTAKRYAPLRQVYYSLILAQWFKQKFYGKGGLYSNLIDKRELNNLTSKTAWDKQIYFKQYQASFQKGEYNLKEPVYAPQGQVIRSYMSGGVSFGGLEIAKQVSSPIKGVRELFNTWAGFGKLIRVVVVAGALTLTVTPVIDKADAGLSVKGLSKPGVSDTQQAQIPPPMIIEGTRVYVLDHIPVDWATAAPTANTKFTIGGFTLTEEGRDTLLAKGYKEIGQYEPNSVFVDREAWVSKTKIQQEALVIHEKTHLFDLGKMRELPPEKVRVWLKVLNDIFVYNFQGEIEQEVKDNIGIYRQYLNRFKDSGLDINVINARYISDRRMSIRVSLAPYLASSELLARLAELSYVLSKGVTFEEWRKWDNIKTNGETKRLGDYIELQMRRLEELSSQGWDNGKIVKLYEKMLTLEEEQRKRDILLVEEAELITSEEQARQVKDLFLESSMLNSLDSYGIQVDKGEDHFTVKVDGNIIFDFGNNVLRSTPSENIRINNNSIILILKENVVVLGKNEIRIKPPGDFKKRLKPSPAASPVTASLADGNKGVFATEIFPEDDVDSRASSAIEGTWPAEFKKMAQDFVINDHNVWLVYADMKKLGLKDKYYGRLLADFFIQDAIRISGSILANYSGIIDRKGDKSDEVAMLLPGKFSPKAIEGIAQEIQDKIKGEYQDYQFAKLPVALEESKIAELKQKQLLTEAMVDDNATYILFKKQESVKLYKEIGVAEYKPQFIFFPYLPVGAVRVEDGQGIEEFNLENELARAKIYQGIAKERHQLHGIESITRWRGEKRPGEPLFTAQEEETITKSLKEAKIKLERSIPPELKDMMRIENNYATMMQRNLYAILEYVSGLRKTELMTYIIRGPPDSFFIVNVINGKWQMILIKQAIVPVDLSLASKLQKVAQVSRRQSDSGLNRFGFKVINDYFGDIFGDQLIMLDSVQLRQGLQGTGLLNTQEISQGLSLAQENINSVTHKKGFGVEFEATVINSDDISEGVESAKKSALALEFTEKLSDARNPEVKLEYNSDRGLRLKIYSENKDARIWGSIENGLKIAKEYRRKRAFEGLVEEDIDDIIANFELKNPMPDEIIKGMRDIYGRAVESGKNLDLAREEAIILVKNKIVTVASPAKPFSGEFYKFTNINAQNLVKNLKEYAPLMKDDESFRHVLRILLKAKENRKNSIEVHRDQYPYVCQSLSNVALYILQDLKFNARRAEVKFSAAEYPDVSIERHFYVIATIANEKFIIDISADQFEPLGNGEFADLGVVVLPVGIVNQNPERFWMYTGKRAPVTGRNELLIKTESAASPLSDNEKFILITNNHDIGIINDPDFIEFLKIEQHGIKPESGTDIYAVPIRIKTYIKYLKEFKRSPEEIAGIEKIEEQHPVVIIFSRSAIVNIKRFSSNEARFKFAKQILFHENIHIALINLAPEEKDKLNDSLWGDTGYAQDVMSALGLPMSLVDWLSDEFIANYFSGEFYSRESGETDKQESKLYATIEELKKDGRGTEFWKHVLDLNIKDSAEKITENQLRQIEGYPDAKMTDSAASPKAEVSAEGSSPVTMKIYGNPYNLPEDTVNNIRLSKIEQEDKEGIEAIIELSKLVDDQQNIGVTRTIYREAVLAQAEREERYRLSGKLELTSGGQFILVYRNERNEVKGFIYAILEKDGKSARIAEIAVDREYQGKDIGETLLAVMMEKMESMGVMRFNALPVNGRSKELFEFFKFEKEKKDNKYYSFTSGAVSSPMNMGLDKAIQQLNNIQISVNGGLFVIRIEKNNSRFDTRIVLRKAKEGKEIGYLEIDTEFSIVDGGYRGGFIKITDKDNEKRGLAKLILRKLKEVFLLDQELVTEVAHEESLDDFKKDAAVSDIFIVKLFKSAGWELTGYGYYDSNGEYHAGNFGELMKSDERKGELGTVIVKFKPENTQLLLPGFFASSAIAKIEAALEIKHNQIMHIDDLVKFLVQETELSEDEIRKSINFINRDQNNKYLVEPTSGGDMHITKKKTVSSSPMSDDTKGGIDLRSLPIMTQPINPGAAHSFAPSTMYQAPIPLAELNNEWQKIENMLAVGLTPSSERIKEYLQSCSLKQDFTSEIDKVLSCIADILRIQEEQVIGTDPALKQVLVLLESDKSADQMQLALAQITVEPKEPRTVEQ